MKRTYLALAFVLPLAAVLLGCGGGGGGSSPTDSAATTTLSGQLTSSGGQAIQSTVVSVSTSTRGTLTATTNVLGYYSIPNVAVNTDLTLSVLNRSWTAMTIPTDVPGSATINIILPPDTPGKGSLISIDGLTTIETGTTPVYTVHVTKPDTTSFNSYQAVWTVVGNIGSKIMSASPYNGRYLALLPSKAGDKARITATVLLDPDGTIATDSIVVNVIAGDGGGEPPPPP